MYSFVNAMLIPSTLQSGVTQACPNKVCMCSQHMKDCQVSIRVVYRQFAPLDNVCTVGWGGTLEKKGARQIENYTFN